jgi:large subunit ribosomal protein L22
MEAVARAKHLRISPRKLRLVADVVRGLKVAEAREVLTFMPNKGAPLLKKVLLSAVANAEHAAHEAGERIDTDEFVVSSLRVNDGMKMLKRIHQSARGRALPYRKHFSHIDITISDASAAKRAARKR